MAKKIIYNITA